jgi:hypothetical protein
MSKSFNWAEYAALLNKLHEACRIAQVSYAIEYEEGGDTFYVSINSSSEKERMVTKSYGVFQSALESAIEHVEKLS